MVGGRGVGEIKLFIIEIKIIINCSVRSKKYNLCLNMIHKLLSGQITENEGGNSVEEIINRLQYDATRSKTTHSFDF